MAGEEDRALAGLRGYNQPKSPPAPDQIEVLRKSPLYDQGFKEWLGGRLEASPAEVEGLLEWAAVEHGVDGFVGDDDWKEEVLDWAQGMRRRFYRYAKTAGVSMTEPRYRKPPPGRKPGGRKRPQVARKTEDKSEVVARYVARRAAQRRDVMSFRRKVLDGQFRNPEEVDSVLSSSAYRSSRGKWESLISDLMAAYGWARPETVEFLVVGSPPKLMPVQTRIVGMGGASDAPAAVELTVAPWATAEEVKVAYQALQRDTLGGDNRPLGDRALRLFRFVTDNEADPESKPPREELLARWNAEHEEEHRYEDLRSFNRDLARIEKIAQRCLAGSAGSPVSE